jgi:predicted nucleic acid-binding protein
MVNLVVDSSVVIKFLAVEPYSTEAGRILADYKVGKLSLIAPDLIDAEVGNIIWKKHVHQGLDAADAQLLLDTYRTLTIQRTPARTLLSAAYQLAVVHRRTVYDMLYVALSISESCQFVTADEKLVNGLGSAVPNVIWLANWP